MKNIVLLLFVFITVQVLAQTPPQNTGPWASPLMICRGNDGINFVDCRVFVDSAGVPNVIQDRSGKLVAVFQWFPAPMRSQNWDKVAVCFSTDRGNTWTKPVPIQILGMPAEYQRAFDPTLSLTDDGKIRIYFSSSPTKTTTLNSTVATYSAISEDGIQYQFEQGIRFSDSQKPVIDPALVKFGGIWYYTAPKGAPQEGAFHATSKDGLVFEKKADIPSDNMHQWTGNLMNQGTSMRFYGGGNPMWFSSSTDGKNWSTYTQLNIMGGDPSVIKLDNSNYLIVYVGKPYSVTATEKIEKFGIEIYPNPTQGILYIKNSENARLQVFDMLGKQILEQNQILNTQIDLSNYPKGLYHCVLSHQKGVFSKTILLD